MATLFMLAFPLIVFASVLAMAVGIFIGLRKMFSSFGGRSSKKSVNTSKTAKRGATPFGGWSAKARWSESPDYSQYESPAFLRTQAA